MKRSVVGEWVEGDALGKTLRRWRALLTLGERGKEGCPIRGPIGSILLDAPRVRLTGDQERVLGSLDRPLDLDLT